MEKKNYTYIDILRIISMICVVCMHVLADNLRDNILTTDWHVYNILSSFMVIAVPIFFMISGALILSSEKTNDIKYTIKNRLLKVFIPLVVWTILNMISLHLTETRPDPWLYTFMRIKMFIRQPVVVHLWFLYALIPLYVLSPLLKILVDNMKKNTVIYTIVVWLICSGLLITLSNITSFSGTRTLMNNDYNLNFLNGYLGYFILGYYLHNTKKEFKYRTLFLVILLNLSIIIFGTAFFERYYAGYFEGFKLYNGIFSIALSVATFMLIKKLFINHEFKEGTKRFLKIISNCTFAIYLMHNLIIKSLHYTFNTATILNTFGFILLTLAICIIITLILGSIPCICYLTTGTKFKEASNSFNLIYIIKSIFNKNKKHQ
ncbi:MAG: acyltransferase [archaeon]|nr:acyltransferase [archaeon]